MRMKTYYLYRIFVKTSRLLARAGFGSIWLTKPIHDYLLRILEPKVPNKGVVSINVMGHKMYVDSSDEGVGQPLIKFGVFGELQTKHFKEQIKKGMTVLDIGANIGYYTLIAARLVGDEGKVIAFEPDPTNFALLKKNVEGNGYKNVILVQKAVSNKAGEVKLFLRAGNLAGHHLYDAHDGNKFVTVSAITLDEYLENENLNKIDFVKMDVEGAEWGVLQGMRNLIEKNNDVKIVLEFWPAGMRRFGIGPEKCINELTSRGFILFDIDDSIGKIHPTDIDRLIQKYTGDLLHTNLFCIRN